MTSLEQMIDSGPLLDTKSNENKVVNLSDRKRKILKKMRKLNQFTGPEFERLYQEWKEVTGYLTFFKELKNSL